MTIDTLGAILLGWLFGILNQLLIDAIRKCYRGKEVHQGIVTELSDLRLRMTAAVCVFESHNVMHDPNKGLSVRKYRVPYLDSNVGDLGIFDEQSRAEILDVRAQLEMFNEEVDEARVYQKMTFDLHDSVINHPIACQLVQNSYKNLGQRAKQIADRIGSILNRQSAKMPRSIICRTPWSHISPPP